MFLKSLVVRGFKSFADKTALEFEPGITIVVGPNGSGKSNVIDAISWVLGEQGPRSLRGGKMEDVIFAGSPGRPALGRAEVSLTIDNSAGLLPIEFSEVTLTRVLFRSGESEYRLNGSPCRLLDIQEVLSDTGVGREQHTIVGQGQLDQVLQAGPEQLRGFIEEAAGVGKHRRRKDRAVRKIASTEQNLMRLSDLLAEVRRQLRPLREQAQLAQKHLEIEREFGRVRLLGAARSLGALRKGITSAGSENFEPQIIAAQDRLRECEEQATSSESDRVTAVRDSEEKQQAAWGFTRSVDRLKSLTKLAAERARSLQAELEGATEAAAQAKLAELKRQSLEIAQMLAQAEATETVCSADAQLAGEALNAGEAELRRLDEDLENAVAACRDATGGLRRLQDEIDILAHSLMEAQTEQFRMDDASTELVAHLAAAVHEIQESNVTLARLEGEEAALTEALAAAEAEVARLEERHVLLSGRATQAEREAMLLRARAEVRVSESSSAEARRIAESREQGVAGLLSDLVKAPPAINASLESWLGRLDCVVAICDPGVNGANLDVVADSGPVRVLVPAGSPLVPGLRPLADQIEFLKPQAKVFFTNVYLAEG